MDTYLVEGVVAAVLGVVVFLRLVLLAPELDTRKGRVLGNKILKIKAKSVCIRVYGGGGGKWWKVMDPRIGKVGNCLGPWGAMQSPFTSREK